MHRNIVARISALVDQVGSLTNRHPNWDGRKHKVFKVVGPVYHGTTKEIADLLSSRMGPLHPGVKAKVRKWVGPVGFYVTKVFDRALEYAKHHSRARGSEPCVLEWDAKAVGIDDVLMVLDDPTSQDIEMAKDMGISAVRGPGLWGILALSPRPVPGKIVHQ